MSVHDFDGLSGKFKRFGEEGMNRILRNIAESVAETLLNNISDEITRQDLINSGVMRNSFSRGDENGLWEWDVDRNAIVLELGSNLPYARYLNEGYTIHKPYFVPGKWKNGKFEYDPDENDGFMAKPRTFIGRHYFDIAVKKLEGGINELILERLEIELRRVFS
ncbi:HK97 gp10 family phage protein [Paenibacillus alvei]|uniref:HK97 gp10 family phage protein n=1 Tax=Paenibacillus alvei TaxID=44250 RepID=UPI0013DA58C8|nr:HK97 gp10 family phage protein [Paenibacillus alvei]MCY7484329.1 HK97 gp10 family phage protein [Paenibacillus alvei]NEZ40270.1 HK97 gp10 family phage protein [Paenibacillus alvei]